MKFLLKENLDFLNTLKEDGKKIVFTNGCFDILHSGHIHTLSEAKKNGDICDIQNIFLAFKPQVDQESKN